MSIPGISTGGGGLDAGSSAAAAAGDILGGAASFNFAGPSLNRFPDAMTLGIYAAIGVTAYVMIKRLT